MLYHKSMEVMNVEYIIKYVMGHVEVYDKSGRFVFSADNESEAYDEINAAA